LNRGVAAHNTDYLFGFEGANRINLSLMGFDNFLFEFDLIEFWMVLFLFFDCFDIQIIGGEY